uniref:MYND-type domain-containing protein n=1 Tax=Syphacia muris TaxID=451379 RepID=A0A0N5AS72_9BILA
MDEGMMTLKGSIHNEPFILDDRMKRMIMDLQRHWLNEYQQSREKILVEMTERLHQEFLSDQQKIRTDLLTQFKEELDTTRAELEQKYRGSLKTELAKMQEKHRKEISALKKKQWCWQCEQEAIYHCCWNTAYCSVECQQSHWPTHRKYCRRKKQNEAASTSTGNGQ